MSHVDSSRKDLLILLAEAIRSNNHLARDMAANTCKSLLETEADFVEYFLDELDKERNKFTESDKNIMQVMVDLLVAAKIYPTLSDRYKAAGLTPLSMLNYGTRWHQYRGLTNCPHCNADLRDPDGPPFKREIGIEIQDLYDGIAFYRCPDCQGGFSRSGKALSASELDNLSREIIFA